MFREQVRGELTTGVIPFFARGRRFVWLSVILVGVTIVCSSSVEAQSNRSGTSLNQMTSGGLIDSSGQESFPVTSTEPTMRKSAPSTESGGVGDPRPARDNAASTDGTWRHEGRYIVMNINGQQYRLVQSDEPDLPATPDEPVGGAVRGRLANRGRPLVGFDVALVPLKKTWVGFAIDRSVNPDTLATALTDATGTYRFTNLPAGLYKLKWRPPGESSWIRKVEFRPDVRVKNNEVTEAKEVRVALRTIN